MNLTRWDPFADIDSLFNRMLPRMHTSWPRGGNGENTEWAPSADISETDKEYLIRAHLPAVKKDDVKVTVDSGMITIEGERKQQKEDKNEKFHRIESFYGSFERSFALPDDVDAKNVRCESKDGVLTVHLPKTETKKSAPVQIKVQ